MRELLSVTTILTARSSSALHDEMSPSRDAMMVSSCLTFSAPRSIFSFDSEIAVCSCVD